MTIAVTGATGQLGRLVIAELKKKVSPEQIIALVRSPDKASDLGVTARQADYSQPDTLVAALAGVDTLLLISSSEVGQRAIQHRNVIDAAKAVGIKRIVYTSLLHADTSPLNLADEHRETEADLKSSGISHTILRNGWYTENYTGSVAAAVAAGAFVGSAGDANISSAPRQDYAEAAAVAVASEGHDGQVYELASDAPYTLTDLAAEISRQTGKDISYKDLPEADYAAILKSIGLPVGLAEAIANWDVGASKGALFDNSGQLSKLIGRPTTPLAQSVKAALAG